MSDKTYIEKYARLIYNSDKEFSYILLKKFYLKNRKQTHCLIKKLFEISLVDKITMHGTKWKILFGQTDEINVTLIKRLISYIDINQNYNKEKEFIISSGLLYNESDIDLSCSFHEASRYIDEIYFNNYLKNKNKDLLLFRIDLKSNKSFKLVKVLPKPLFYSLLDSIFK